MGELTRLAGVSGLALLLGFVSGHGYRGEVAKVELQALKAEHLALAVQAEEQARIDFEKMVGVKDDAIEAHKERVQKLEAAAAAAGRTADSLRADLAKVPARINAATRAAVDGYAATCTAVLAECAGEVTGLAGKADGHANDARLMLEAWPRGLE